jgi:hypothetical protein
VAFIAALYGERVDWQNRRELRMTRRTKFAAMAVAVGVVIAAAAGTGITLARGGDDSEPPITGAALERASRAALEHTGGGRVSETEVGDEESLYEVEVTLDDGTQVDVQLDESFNVVGDSVDDENEDDDAGADD